MILVQVKNVLRFKIDMDILRITKKKTKLHVIIKPLSQATSLPVMKCVETSLSGEQTFSQEVITTMMGYTL